MTLARDGCNSDSCTWIITDSPGRFHLRTQQLATGEWKSFPSITTNSQGGFRVTMNTLSYVSRIYPINRTRGRFQVQHEYKFLTDIFWIFFSPMSHQCTYSAERETIVELNLHNNTFTGIEYDTCKQAVFHSGEMVRRMFTRL